MSPLPAFSAADRAALDELEELAARGAAGVPALVERLGTPSWALRRAATAALSCLGEDAAVKLWDLVRTRRDDERRVSAAIEALSASSADVESLLLRSLARESPAVLCDAAQILGRRKSPAAVAALAGLVAHADDNVAVSAIEALGRVGGAAAMAPLLAAATSGSFFRRFPLIDVLGRGGDPRAVPVLASLLEQPLYAVAAARALGRTGARQARGPLLAASRTPPGPFAGAVAVALAELEERCVPRSGPALHLTPPVYAILSQLIEEKTGIHHDESSRELLSQKLTARAVAAGFDSLLDYYYFLRYDEGSSLELDRLIDAVVVNETYFFREPDGLEMLVGELLAPAISRGERPRVLCAGCSTGEEPLTLEMMLAERGLAERCEIIATDLSLRALERARSGAHAPRSTRALPDSARRWVSQDGETVKVDGSIHRAIDWRRMNLCEASAVAALGTFDAILCRNVLIYFSDETARRVIDGLARALRPGGALLVGVSESLVRLGTRLSCEQRGDAFLYRSPP